MSRQEEIQEAISSLKIIADQIFEPDEDVDKAFDMALEALEHELNKAKRATCKDCKFWKELKMNKGVGLCDIHSGAWDDTDYCNYLDKRCESVGWNK